MTNEVHEAHEVRQRSYRNGITLSGGETTAHFYMNLASSASVPIGMLEGTPEETAPFTVTLGKNKYIGHRLAIVGRLKAAHDGSLFATEVDESTLVEARNRMQAKFGLVSFEPTNVLNETMGDVINPKVASYLQGAEFALTTNRPENCLRILVKVNHLDKEGSAAIECQMRFVALTELCDFRAAHVMATRTNFPAERLSWCYFAYGQSLMDVGLFDQALNAFEAAAKLEPNRIDHRLKQIEALYKMKRYIQCIGVVTDLLRECRNDKPRRADLYTLRGRLHDLLSNVKDVLGDIERALRIDPGHPGANKFLRDFRKKADDMRDEAMTMYAKGRFKEAVEKLSTCMQANPNNPDYFFKRGLVNRRLGDYRQAVNDLLEAMEKMELVTDADDIPPKVMEDARRQLILLLNDMAVDCYHRKMYDDAIHLLERAIRFDNQEIAFYVNRGDCFYALEDFGSSLNDYEQANELAPHNEAIVTRLVLLHSHRGLLAMRERNFADAENALSLAIKVRSHDYDLYSLRCRARLMLNQSQEASHDLVACLILNAPTNDPHIATLLPRFFPGMSAEDVLASEIGQGVLAEMAVLNEEAALARQRSTLSQGSPITRLTIGCMTFSADVAELLNDKLLIHEEMRFLASDMSREAWLHLAAKLAPRTTKWRGKNEGPLERPLSRPGVARLTADGHIKLVNAKKDAYAFRWQGADVKSLKVRKSPKKTREPLQIQLNGLKIEKTDP